MDADLDADGGEAGLDPAGEPSATAPEPDAEGSGGEPGSEGAGAEGREPEGEGQQPESESGKDTAADPQGDDEHLTDEEWKALSPKTRRRINSLYRQAREAEEVARRGQPFAQAIEQHRLDPNDAMLAIGLTGALQRGDWNGFLQGVMPLVEVARQQIGESIPPDLQQRVEHGEITQALAAQLGRERAQAQWRSHMSEADRRRAEQEQHAARQQQAAHAIQVSVSQREQALRSQDPDFATKEPVIRRFAQALVQERGLPRTPQEAVVFFEQAYQEADRLFKQTAAPRPGTRRMPSSERTAPTSGQDPANLMDAIEAGLARANR